MYARTHLLRERTTQLTHGDKLTSGRQMVSRGDRPCGKKDADAQTAKARHEDATVRVAHEHELVDTHTHTSIAIEPGLIFRWRGVLLGKHPADLHV